MRMTNSQSSRFDTNGNWCQTSLTPNGWCQKIVSTSNLTPTKNDTNPADKSRLVSKVGVNASSPLSENG